MERTDSAEHSQSLPRRLLEYAARHRRDIRGPDGLRKAIVHRAMPGSSLGPERLRQTRPCGHRMTSLATAVTALSLAAPPPVPLVREPKTGATFAARIGDMSLLGVGVRTKTFLKVKVYAIGLYVADSALAGPLGVHKGNVGTSAFYRDLITGDFEKVIILKPARDLSAEQIRGAFRSHMPQVDRQLLDQFLSYFAETRAGQECVLRWAPGGILETNVAGVAKLPIGDRAFSQAVFAIWLGDRPVEDEIRKRLVSRTGALLK